MVGNRVIDKTKIEEMSLDQRVKIEADITDERARQQVMKRLLQKRVEPAEYIAAQPWRQYLFGWIGDLSGKRILDVGCGYSMTPITLALAGAEVVAVDVSPEALMQVERFAVAKGVRGLVQTHCGPAEQLPFDGGYFDLAFGGAALHHFQIVPFAKELHRVLKPGGRAGFQDPLGENPLLEWARDHVPYRNRHPVKGVDNPLRFAQVDEFCDFFSKSEYRTFDALGMLSKVLHMHRLSPWREKLAFVDTWLFRHVPVSRYLARFVVTCVEK